MTKCSHSGVNELYQARHAQPLSRTQTHFLSASFALNSISCSADLCTFSPIFLRVHQGFLLISRGLVFEVFYSHLLEGQTRFSTRFITYRMLEPWTESFVHREAPGPAVPRHTPPHTHGSCPNIGVSPHHILSSSSVHSYFPWRSFSPVPPPPCSLHLLHTRSCAPE